ncbi:MAG: SIR2 family protein [Acutalibacteraceae bacterium]|nr:SIR2 family protein [Acutalibacteraceae bacterium]
MNYKYLNSIPKPLLNDFLNNRVIPFVGAGFSKNADVPDELTMPDWNELGKCVAKEIPNYEYDNNPIDALSYYEDLFSRTKLIEFLLRQLNYGKIKPGDTYKALCDLFTGTICTTNFDSLLEDALTLLHQPVSVVATKDRLTIENKNERKIIKLHGDFNHPDKMVITERDYDTYIEKNPIFATYIANLFITNTMLLIGYSLEDYDFRSIWQIINSRLNNMTQPAYCILVNASEEKIARYRRRNIRVINLKGNKKNYKTILKELFIEIKDFVSKETERNLKSSDEKINAQMIIPAEDNKLCFISCAMSRISRLTAMLYPILQNLDITPVRIDNILMPGDNWIDVSSAVIRKSKAAIIDISDKSPNVMLELGLITSEKSLKNSLIICEKGSAPPAILTGHLVLSYSFNDLLEKDTTFVINLEQWCKEVFCIDNKPINENKQNTPFNNSRELISKKEYSASIISAASELENLYHKTKNRNRSFGQIFVEYRLIDYNDRQHPVILWNRIVHHNYEATLEDANNFLKTVEIIYNKICKS